MIYHPLCEKRAPKLVESQPVLDYSDLLSQRGQLKLGVLSDTHIPFRLSALPDSVETGLQGADVILHAGDLEDTDLITRLARIAPTHAVSGNLHWTFAHGITDASLPKSVSLRAGPHKLWMTHGHLRFGYTFLDKLDIGARLLLRMLRLPVAGKSLAMVNARLLQRLMQRKPADASIVVFGHSHGPLAQDHDGVLYFNPGAVTGADRGLAKPSIGRLILHADGHVDASHIPL